MPTEHGAGSDDRVVNPDIHHEESDVNIRGIFAFAGALIVVAVIVHVAMWVFLVTEVLFFGGLFTVYAVYRGLYPYAFAAASHELDIGLGTTNTAVLITSSLTMALAVHAAQLGQRRVVMTFLMLTMALGLTFLGIKGLEYYHKFVEHHVPGPDFQFEKEYFRHAQLFFSLYFLMTGLHALHMSGTRLS